MLLASCSSFKREHAKPGLGPAAWTTFDGKQMPWKEWKVPSGTETKTVVIAIHGLSGAASDFWLLGERLPPQGIAVYGYELRGQGNDPDTVRRGDIDSASLWLRDLLTFHRLVRAELIPHYNSPFAVETAHVKVANSDLTVRVIRSLFDTARRWSAPASHASGRRRRAWLLFATT